MFTPLLPLRESAAMILTEQTIGRGLRLPYSERTGVPLVDRLVLVAHEQFAKVVALAKDSPLIQGQVEQISQTEAKEIKVLTEIQPVVLQEVAKEIRQNEIVMEEVEKQVAEEIAKMPQAESMDEAVKEKITEIKTDEKINSLSKATCDVNTFSQYHKQPESVPMDSSFASDTLFGFFSDKAREELAKIAIKSGETMEKRNIPIPRLMLTPHFGELLITDFNLDVGSLRFYTNERAILEEQLQNDREKNLFNEEVPGRRMTEVTRVSSFGSHTRQSPQSTVIAALLDFPLVDYDDPAQKPLLLKLASQAVEHYRKKAIDEENLALIIESNARTIGEDIYKQILDHKEFKSEGYLESDLREPKSYPAQYGISLSFGEKPVSLESQSNTFSAKLTYGNFQKACHTEYRFDSSDEARLAYLLDNDEAVKDWLRPAPNQFEGLFWRDEDGNSQHKYEPDFVVELKYEIVMIEVKPESEINTPSVQAKKQTADKYCEVVNKNIGHFGIIKPWRYIIISTDRITVSSTIGGLLK
jgi:type III restriction enzyme